MIKKDLILGIDTSNYTTSIALVNENKNLLLDERMLLNVKEGQKGLRQADALFQHVMNLPDLFSRIKQLGIGNRIKKVSISNRPRPREDSYMPVFKAAQSFGKSIANVLGCLYEEYSHQEGHIEAAKWSIKKDFNQCVALHLSGGTTEILHVRKKTLGYDINIIGGTSDISAGQMIDRVGVALGYKFPAGKELDQIALQVQDSVAIPVSVKNAYMSFSGPETAVQRMIYNHTDSSKVILGTFECIGKSLAKAIKNACMDIKIYDVLISGGVGSSRYLNEYLSEKFRKDPINIHFGNPTYCTDNAVGTALLAIHKEENR